VWNSFIALLATTPIDEAIIVSILGKDTQMPVWLLILIAALFGWLVLPKIVAYVNK
jgi:ABC-type microcin C transport system permease subunit YejE